MAYEATLYHGLRVVRQAWAELGRKHRHFIGSAALLQLLPLISAPILARVYQPSDYGLFALYLATVTVLVVVLGLSLTNAILTEEKDEDAIAAGIGASLLAAGGALLLLVPVAVLAWLSWGVDGWALSAGVVAVLLICVLNCAYTWAIRTERFQLVSSQRIWIALAATALQIGLGLVHPVGHNFLLVHVLTQLATLALLLHDFWNSPRRSPLRVNFGLVHRVWARHRRLAVWTTPGSLVNTLSASLPDLMVGKFFGTATLGQLAMGNRVLNVPLSVLSSSMQEIFRQKSSSAYIETGTCKTVFRHFLVLQILFSVFLVLPIIFSLPWIIPVLFGPQWDQSAAMLLALAPVLIIRFVSSPLSYVWIIYGFHRMNFFWQLGLLSLGLAGFLGPMLATKNATPINVLNWYSISVSFWYTVCIAISWNIVHRRKSV